MAFYSAALNLLKYIPSDVEKMLKRQIGEWESAVNKANGRLRYDSSEKDVAAVKRELTAQLADLRTKHIGELNDLRAEVKTRQMQVENDVHIAMGDTPTSDKTELLLRSTERQAAWSRMVRLLDVQKGQALTDAARTFAEHALQRGDENALQALLVELPTYQMARNHDGSNVGLDSYQRARQSPLAAVHDVVKAARPDVRDALDALADLPRGISQVSANIDYAVAAFERLDKSTTIVEWDGSTKPLSMGSIDSVPLNKVMNGDSPMRIAIERQMMNRSSGLSTVAG